MTSTRLPRRRTTPSTILLKRLWWVLQLFPQQHYDKEDQKIQWRVPYGVPRHIPKHAIIHPSAVRRLECTVPGEKPYRPRNLKRDDLQPLQSPVPGTTADLTGCFVYAPKDTQSAASDKTAVRLAKLFLGWISFGLFWLIIATLVWYVLGAIILVLFRGLAAAVAHTPKLRDLLRWALS